MAWRRPGDKPLSEPMMVRLPTHICVTRPQWVNQMGSVGLLFVDWTKRAIFFLGFFQMHFHERQFSYFDSSFTEVCLWCPFDNKVLFDSGNDLSLKQLINHLNHWWPSSVMHMCVTELVNNCSSVCVLLYGRDIFMVSIFVVDTLVPICWQDICNHHVDCLEKGNV